MDFGPRLNRTRRGGRATAPWARRRACRGGASTRRMGAVSGQHLEQAAERIERAYRRRAGRWHPGCSSSRVWRAAATVLWEAHRADRRGRRGGPAGPGPGAVPAGVLYRGLPGRSAGHCRAVSGPGGGTALVLPPVSPRLRAALAAGSLSGGRSRAGDAPSRPVTARDSAVQRELTD